MSIGFFTAELRPREVLTPSGAYRAPSSGEPMIEFPITARSYNLGEAPTREEVLAMVAELSGGEQPTTERIVQDLDPCGASCTSRMCAR